MYHIGDLIWFWLSYLGPLIYLLPKRFLIIWLSNLWTLSVSDKCYSRNVSCALILISMFLFFYPLFNLLYIRSFVLNNWILSSNLNINDVNAQIWKMSKRTQWFLRGIRYCYCLLQGAIKNIVLYNISVY